MSKKIPNNSIKEHESRVINFPSYVHKYISFFKIQFHCKMKKVISLHNRKGNMRKPAWKFFVEFFFTIIHTNSESDSSKWEIL